MFRIAAVSFFNTKPLIFGLAQHPRVRLALDVPSRLLDLMQNDQADVALLPVIDFQRWDRLRILPAGAIGSDGPTHTVRIFSRRPIGQISSLSCDIDSHTSVALSRVILGEQFSRVPQLVPSNDPRADECDAKLLIGDKVVLSPPTDHRHQLDLGEAWKTLTGLPFVFAVWMARDNLAESGQVQDILLQARKNGLAHVEEILASDAAPTGWPMDLARAYLTTILTYEFADVQRLAMEKFYRLCVKHRVISHARQFKLAGKES